ncbi:MULTISPECIES: hypothetical protein [Nostocales]|uniref:Uncharacterized protein n=3 Tax=Nostocales TaxID=1161 RepID=A0A8S9TFB5_9CYAN|nr:hypothetical protein [Tolypothrix bouteillei]KAF3890312.1 hypothetical protein DA73_0400036340 [Tolypothrix bouteillei VB521301]
MTTNKTTNSNNTISQSEGQNKEALNQKTSVQFVTSATIGVLVIILLAASAYFGIIKF